MWTLLNCDLTTRRSEQTFTHIRIRRTRTEREVFEKRAGDVAVRQLPLQPMTIELRLQVGYCTEVGISKRCRQPWRDCNAADAEFPHRLAHTSDFVGVKP